MVNIIGIPTGRDSAPTAARPAATAGINKQQFEMYQTLLGQHDPMTAAKIAGIPEELAGLLTQAPETKDSQARQIVGNLPTFGPAGDRIKQSEAVRASQRQSNTLINQMIDAAEALDRIVAEEETAIGIRRSTGPGAWPSVVRFLDRNLEGIIDIGAGTQTDWQKINKAMIDNVAEYAQQWSGAISNYENQLFILGAPGPDKTAEYNRGEFGAAIAQGAQGLIMNTMLDEANQLRGSAEPLVPSDPAFSSMNVELALKWLAENAGLTPPAGMDKTSPEFLDYAKKWADFARSGNRALIREAFLRTLAAANLNTNDLEDPRVTAAIGKEGLTTASEPDQPDPTLGSVSEEAMNQDSVQTAREAAEQQGAVTAATAEGLSEGQSQAGSATMPQYSSETEAIQALEAQLQSGGEVVTTFTVGGRQVTINRFPDPAAAVAFLEQQQAAGAPIPKIVIIGNQVRRVQ